jgi:putative hydrolase of the HAD superfamily
MLSHAHISFDLDDTLYPEKDYVDSCFAYVNELLTTLYEVPNISARLSRAYEQGLKDPIGDVCRELKLPPVVKQDAISAMRAHLPSIALSNGAEKVVQFLFGNRRKISVITDGRSVTQRRKLEALGLLGKAQLLISEETGHPKPSEVPFQLVMQEHPEANNYWYVADNPARDFVAPNRLGWTTVMLKATSKNIHRQLSKTTDHAAQIIVDSLDELCHMPKFAGLVTK